MGDVWLATELRLGRKVALKLLPSDLTRDTPRVKRFQQEARAASSLNHPNVCTIFALGETAEGRQYIAMEYVEGHTLRYRLASGRLPTREALDIAIQAVSALATAHAAGIVHRDVKPENIMVRPDGLVKVLDFGLAKLTSAAGASEGLSTQTALTHAGAVMGTIAYMSPEQARGEPVDSRTDVWAMGCVLYEMLAGRSPFAAASTSEVIAAILDRDPPALHQSAPQTSLELERIVSKTLRKDRAERYQDTRDLLVDLRALHGTQTPSTQRRSPGREAAITHGVSRAQRWRPRIAIGLALMLAVCGSLLWRARAPAAAHNVRSLAVLPLVNLSGDTNQEYFADGMTDALITELAQINDVRVISRTSVMRYKHTTKTLDAVGRELGVDAIIEGSVRASGGRVGISVNLVHAASERHLWAHTFERNFEDVLTLHREVAVAVAAETRRTLLDNRPPKRVIPAAYDAYARGRHYWNLRNEASLRTAIEHFERAITIDPAYAAAYSGLADSYFYSAYAFGRMAPIDGMPRAREAALKSLELESHLAEGHTSLAVVHMMYDWDWENAERGFRKAIELNPSYSLAHHAYAALLMTLGRQDESVAEAQRALEVDPLSFPIRNIVSSMLYVAGRYEEAMAGYRETIELHPNVPSLHGELGETLKAMGRDAEALREFLTARQMGGEPPEVVNALTRAFERDGWQGFYELELKRALGRYDGWHWDAGTLAFLSARAGHRREALKWVNVAYNARSGWIVWIPADRSLNELLKDDPDYRELLTKMRLPLP
jgi:eukaryotic-like serine/threonine-protein kinase